MFIAPEWMLAGLSLVAVFLWLGLCLGVGFAVCVWKPEHAYDTLLRVRRFFVRPPQEVTAWSVD